jgi:short-subunit dehydrogenase
MNKTVLITGCSSGIGKDTALLFAKKGWNVIATMRKPNFEKELNEIPNIFLVQLDVTDVVSIENAIKLSIEKYNKIDVLVNNAGYSVTGIFEGITEEQMKKQFDTNVIGLMNLTKAVLPFMRSQKSGCIINISSIAGKVALPLYSAYHATKFAVEGFSESLQYELKPFNIKVKIIEPGIIDTDFYYRSMEFSKKDEVLLYRSFFEKVKKILDFFAHRGGSKSIVVAKEIYVAAISNSYRLRYPVGGGAIPILLLRKIIPPRLLRKLIYHIMYR